MIYKYSRYVERLSGDYRKVFDKVEVYAQLHQISEKVSGEKLMDLLDMLLAAQEDGKETAAVIGEDIEKFCRQYFSDYGWREVLENFVNLIYYEIWWLFIFGVICLIPDEGKTVFTTEVELKGWIFIVIAAGFVLSLEQSLRGVILWRTKLTAKWCTVITLFVFAGVLFGLYRTASGISISFPAVWFTVVCGFLLLLCMLARYKWYGSIRRQKTEYEESFGDIVREEMESDEKNPQSPLGLARGFLEDYQKQNEKRERKGKALLTKEQYMERLYRNERYGGFAGSLGMIGAWIIIGCFSVNVALSSTLADTIIYVVLVIVIQLVIWRGLYKKGILGRIDRAKKELFDECKGRRITIWEYVGEKERELTEAGTKAAEE